MRRVQVELNILTSNNSYKRGYADWDDTIGMQEDYY